MQDWIELWTEDLPSLDGTIPLVVITVILVMILIVSFRSRARVFCQYLKLMTGITLTPQEVQKVFRLRGQEGVRELFLDLLIREDLKAGPISPEEATADKPASSLLDA